MLKKITIYIVLAALCPNFAPLQAQHQASERPIQIGDKIPDLHFDQLLNHPTAQAKLSDFKNKVIILDFWATWCSSCIQAFPHSQQLQGKHRNLQFLLINNSNRDDRAKIQTFLDNFKKDNPNFGLPIVIGNAQTRQLYLKGSIPHYIWIGYDRKVKAITGPAAITEENIEKFVAGQPLNLLLKPGYQPAEQGTPMGKYSPASPKQTHKQKQPSAIDTSSSKDSTAQNPTPLSKNTNNQTNQRTIQTHFNPTMFHRINPTAASYPKKENSHES